MIREEEIRARAEAELKNLQRSPLVMISGPRVEKVLGEDIPYMLDENARLRAELEAAVSDMEALADREADPCDFCNSKGACHRPDSCPRAGYRNFKWRGSQEGANE